MSLWTIFFVPIAAVWTSGIAATVIIEIFFRCVARPGHAVPGIQNSPERRGGALTISGVVVEQGMTGVDFPGAPVSFLEVENKPRATTDLDLLSRNN